jgi:hypothetical protein
MGKSGRLNALLPLRLQPFVSCPPGKGPGRTGIHLPSSRMTSTGPISMSILIMMNTLLCSKTASAHTYMHLKQRLVLRVRSTTYSDPRQPKGEDQGAACGPARMGTENAHGECQPIPTC